MLVLKIYSLSYNKFINCFQRGITDRFNPIVVDYSVMVEEVNIPEGDGNATPEDFSDYPVVSATGVSTVQVSTM